LLGFLFCPKVPRQNYTRPISTRSFSFEYHLATLH
jgi:hypothetical protein